MADSSRKAAKPAATSNHGIPILPLAILAGLLYVAVDALHLQLGRAKFDTMAQALKSSANTRLRTHYTGIEPLDEFLTTLVILFDPIFTFEKPALSLFAFHFGGQFISAVTLIMVQGLRSGKTFNITRFSTLWGLLIQLGGYGVVMPFYYIIDLLFSSSAPQDLSIADPAALHVVVPTFLLGFSLPTGILAAPLNPEIHQLLLALWQPFPIYVAILSGVFSLVLQRTSTSFFIKKKGAVDGAAVDQAYSFAMMVGALSHWTTIFTIVLAKVVPWVFPDGVAAQLTFTDVFIPNPVHWYGAKGVADVMFQFLQYDQYIGAAAGLVWAAEQARRAGVWSLSVGNVQRIVRDVLLMGPPTAVLSLLWERDDTIFDDEE